MQNKIIIKNNNYKIKQNNNYNINFYQLMYQMFYNKIIKIKMKLFN